MAPPTAMGQRTCQTISAPSPCEASKLPGYFGNCVWWGMFSDGTRKHLNLNRFTTVESYSCIWTYMNNHGGQQNLLSTSEIFQISIQDHALEETTRKIYAWRWATPVSRATASQNLPKWTRRWKIWNGPWFGAVWRFNSFEGLGPSVCHFVVAMGFYHSWDSFTIKRHSRTKSWGQDSGQNGYHAAKLDQN